MLGIAGADAEDAMSSALEDVACAVRLIAAEFADVLIDTAKLRSKSRSASRSVTM